MNSGRLSSAFGKTARAEKKSRLAFGLTLVLLVLLIPSLFCRGSGQKGEGLEKKVSAFGAEVPEGKALPGRIVFQSNLDGDSEIYLLDGGRLTRLTDNGWEDRYPRWSPDGRAIAFSANPHGNFDIFVMNDRGEDVTQVTNSPLDEVDLAWSPDGKGLAFTEEKKRILGKGRAIWIIELGSKDRKRLVPSFDDSHQLPDFSSASPYVAFTGKRTPGWDVFLYDLKSREIRNLTQGGKSCRPRFSADGGRIAYVSHEADGKGDIWILETEGANPRRLTARDKAYDYFPSWSPDGERVVFCSNLKDMYAEKGDWGLYLANVRDGSVTLLFDSPGRDVFPDWR